MAKYNLMDTEKPDYFDRYFDEDDDKKVPPKNPSENNVEQAAEEIDDREYFDESLFTEEDSPDIATPEEIPDIQPEKPQEQKITEEHKEEILQPEQISEPEKEKPLPPPKPQPTQEEYDYEDSKIQGINWKPLLIWGSVFVVIAVIIFFLYTWFFSNGEEQAVVEQKPVISAQEQLKIDQEKKKIAFIQNIVEQKKVRLNNFSTLSSLKVSNVSYSSVLLYGDSFNFEVFGQTRDDVAVYNQNLKKNRYDNKFKILTVSSRPGSNGGIFALYKTEPIGKSGSSSAGDISIDPNIQNKVKNLINSNGLKILSERTISTKKVDQFTITRNEITINGKEANCQKLLQDLNLLNNNFNVHKISLIPTNQRNIKTSKYNLLLVLDFYI